MNYSDLSSEEKDKWEKLARDSFHVGFYNLMQKFNQGECLFCKYSLHKPVLEFNKKFIWDGEYLFHIKESHGYPPDEFDYMIKDSLATA